MSVEKPLNLEQFFITRNEEATRKGSKLELQAMGRIREHMVEKQAEATQKKETNKKDK